MHGCARKNGTDTISHQFLITPSNQHHILLQLYTAKSKNILSIISLSSVQKAFYREINEKYKTITYYPKPVNNTTSEVSVFGFLP